MRVDADVVDNLIDKQENVDSVLSKDEVEQAKKLFEFQIPETTITVEVKGLSQDAAPVIATRPEFMRRMKDMASMGGFVNPQNAEFVCLTSAVSLPAIMSIVTVGGAAKRLTGVMADQGISTLMLADPEDVR